MGEDALRKRLQEIADEELKKYANPEAMITLRDGDGNIVAEFEGKDEHVTLHSDDGPIIIGSGRSSAIDALRHSLANGKIVVGGLGESLRTLSQTISGASVQMDQAIQNMWSAKIEEQLKPVQLISPNTTVPKGLTQKDGKIYLNGEYVADHTDSMNAAEAEVLMARINSIHKRQINEQHEIERKMAEQKESFLDRLKKNLENFEN